DGGPPSALYGRPASLSGDFATWRAQRGELPLDPPPRTTPRRRSPRHHPPHAELVAGPHRLAPLEVDLHHLLALDLPALPLPPPPPSSSACPPPPPSRARPAGRPG